MRNTLADLETTDADLDRLDIRKLYSSASGEDAQEWYLNMENPRSDRRLRNLQRANLRRMDDGSWYVDGTENDGKGQVRLEAWSESGNKKWLNTEVTVYGFYIEDLPDEFDPGRYAFQLYSGGGHHSSREGRRCEGACYKVRLYKNGKIAVVKEPQHPVYCRNRGTKKAIDEEIRGRWIGLKQVRYNFKEDNKVYVANEAWIDDGSDSNGELVIRNRWRRVANVHDRGGWDASAGQMEDLDDNCPRLDMNANRRDREVTDIINMPGGTDEGNLAALRCDGVRLKFKFFSVREIKPPTPDEPSNENED
jgi:hypothetical protein